MYIIGLILVIIIILILITQYFWIRKDNYNYVWGMISPKGGSDNGNIKYLDTFTTQDKCESACDEQEWCNAYTWHDGNSGEYANMCYGVKNPGKGIEQSGRYSGIRSKPIATFSNTLQRRVGMGSAAESYATKSCVGSFDCVGETFNSKNVAKNTIWDGFHRASIL